MDWDTNWAATAIGILFFLTGFGQVSESVRARVPWSPFLALIAGAIVVLSGVFWDNWHSVWFKFPVMGLLIVSLLVPLIGTTKTDYVRIRFVRALWDGMNGSRPYIDFIFQMANVSSSRITIVGATGWIEINGSRCSIAPQTSRHSISRGDTRIIRVRQPVAARTPGLAKRRQAEFTFSTCKLVFDTGDEVSLGGVRNLMVS